MKSSCIDLLYYPWNTRGPESCESSRGLEAFKEERTDKVVWISSCNTSESTQVLQTLLGKSAAQIVQDFGWSKSGPAQVVQDSGWSKSGPSRKSVCIQYIYKTKKY